MNTLEPFNHIRVEYFEKHGRGMVRLENADIIETNSGVEKSLKKACTAGFFSEFVDRLTKEREKHTELFYILKEVLTQVKHSELAYSGVLFYQLKMLETLGYMPNFNSCVYCGKNIPDEKKIHFSKERGGILCPVCVRFLPYKEYPEGIISKLSSIQDSEKTEINTVFEQYAADIIEGFISFHLDLEFKSYKILKSVIAG
jgi:DNA repair protein RecO (recombination protein O)